eukprot:COSAG01_NODE_29147_length_644_cov_1.238532_1_plen_119_part_00
MSPAVTAYSAGWGANNATHANGAAAAAAAARAQVAAEDLTAAGTARSNDGAVSWVCRAGSLSGGDLKVANLTVEAAMGWCGGNPKCAGFTASTHVGACGEPTTPPATGAGGDHGIAKM